MDGKPQRDTTNFLQILKTKCVRENIKLKIFQFKPLQNVQRQLYSQQISRYTA